MGTTILHRWVEGNDYAMEGDLDEALLERARAKVGKAVSMLDLRAGLDDQATSYALAHLLQRGERLVEIYASRETFHILGYLVNGESRPRVFPHASSAEKAEFARLFGE